MILKLQSTGALIIGPTPPFAPNDVPMVGAPANAELVAIIARTEESSKVLILLVCIVIIVPSSSGLWYYQLNV
jgi:hypothetical protein